jgi:hypothetical protein
MLNISTTKTRAVVRINEVLAGDCVLPFYYKSLAELKGSQEGFEVVVNLAMLKTRSPDDSPIVPPISEPPREVETNLTVIQPTAEELAGTADESDEIHADDEMLVGLVLSKNSDSSNSESESGYVQPATSDTVDTNIFCDVFHVQDRVNKEVYLTHTLHAAFAQAFTDTMLVPGKGDKRKVEAVLQKKELSWDKVRRSAPAWLWKRV